MSLENRHYLTQFSMIAAQCYQLFTDWAAAICFPLALLGVAYYSLHLVTAWQPTVGVPTLARMHQTLDTPLNAQLPSLLRITCWSNFSTSSIQIKTKFLHFMWMPIFLITCDA